MIRKLSSRKVTTIKKRPTAGKYLQGKDTLSAKLQMVPCNPVMATKHSHGKGINKGMYLKAITYGFMGSETVSSQSSILLVCSRIASKGLGSFVASALPGPPNGF